jgi:hypothetical protein
MRTRTIVWSVVLSVVGASAVLLWVGRPCACMPPEEVVRLKLGEIDKALCLYEAEQGQLPATEVGLQALVAPPKGRPYFRDPVLDPWHRPFRYFAPARDGGSRWELVSLGPDGLLDTDDDMVRVSRDPPRQRR